MTGMHTRGKAARDIRTRHPACRRVAQGEFRHAVREVAHGLPEPC